MPSAVELLKCDQETGGRIVTAVEIGDRSQFLQILLSECAADGDVVQVKLPTNDDTVMTLVHLYLSLGIIPTKVPVYLFPVLEPIGRYLLLQDLRHFSLVDEIVNEFNPEDRFINKSKVLSEVNYASLLSNGVRKPVPYPIFIPTRRSYTPLQLAKWFQRLDCPYQPCQTASLVGALLQIEGLVIAGGFCCHLLSPRSFYKHICEKTDIDCFVVGPGPINWKKMVEKIHDVYVRCTGDLAYVCTRTAYAVTFFRLSTGHRYIVQLVLRENPTLEDVMVPFDLDSSCFVLRRGPGDRIQMMTNERGWRFIRTGYNIVDVARRSPTFELRLTKYSRYRKAGVAIPGYDPHRIQYPHHQKRGLGWLLSSPYDYTRKITGSMCLCMLKKRLGFLLRYFEEGKRPIIVRLDGAGVFDLTEKEKELYTPLRAGRPEPEQGWFESAYTAKIGPENIPTARKIETGTPVEIYTGPGKTPLVIGGENVLNYCPV